MMNIPFKQLRYFEA
jgi:LysR family hydrogen peroxide-inducible transcriptional activator